LEPAAFEAVYREHYGRVLAYGLRRTARVNAEDMAATTWLIAWRRRSELRGDPLPWLLGIARRVLSNQLRTARRGEALRLRVSASLERNDSAVDVAGDRAVATALATLSERDQEVLLLIAWEDLSPTQAATVLRCSPATLRVRLHRAKKRFAQALAKAEPADVLVPTRSSAAGGAGG
jgi:RNA polymerase sigma-70 factor, ECF subfamily